MSERCELEQLQQKQLCEASISSTYTNAHTVRVLFASYMNLCNIHGTSVKKLPSAKLDFMAFYGACIVERILPNDTNLPYNLAKVNVSC